MFKKSLVAVTVLASATAAMTSTAHAGWGWIANQNNNTWQVYDYSAGGWSTVYTQNHVNMLNRTIAMKQTQINQKNGLIASLKASVAAQSAEIAELNVTIDGLNADLDFANGQVEFHMAAREAAEAQLSNTLDALGSAYAELNAADAEIASLTAELAIANAELAAQPEVPGAPAVPDAEAVSTLMDTVAGSTIGGFLTAGAIDTFIHNGVLPNGSDINAIIEFDPEGGAALQELRDIRVAQVEAGMAHEAYEIHDYNTNASVTALNDAVDSQGVDVGTYVTISINGKSFDSASVTSDGGLTGKIFAEGESVADWVDGFEDGYNAGYEDGYADGFADGYAAGVSDSQ